MDDCLRGLVGTDSQSMLDRLYVPGTVTRPNNSHPWTSWMLNGTFSSRSKIRCGNYRVSISSTLKDIKTPELRTTGFP